MVEITQALLEFIGAHGWLVSFLGGLVTSEEALLPLSFAAANGYIKLWVVYVFGFLGAFFCDMIVFTIGKRKWAKSLTQFENVAHLHDKFDELVVRITNKSTFKTLFYAKFILGIRTLVLFYLGLKGVSYKKMISRDLLVTAIWLTMVVALGWYAGRGFKFLLEVVQSIQLAISVIVLIIIIIIVSKKLISNFLIKIMTRNGQKQTA